MSIGDLSNGGSVDWARLLAVADNKRMTGRKDFILFMECKLKTIALRTTAKVEQFVICEDFNMREKKFIGHF
jgi:hypothetical protein